MINEGLFSNHNKYLKAIVIEYLMHKNKSLLQTFWGLFILLGCVSIIGCAEKGPLSRIRKSQVEFKIYEHLCTKSKLNPRLCEKRSSINTDFFEDPDSVMNSVGYDVFDELVKKAVSKGISAEDSIKCQSAEPYIRLSEIVLDSSSNFAMLSYVRYINPLNAEEVCAIYRVKYSRQGAVAGVELVWAHQISVS
jgi:hypothetical protein